MQQKSKRHKRQSNSNGKKPSHAKKSLASYCMLKHHGESRCSFHLTSLGGGSLRNRRWHDGIQYMAIPSGIFLGSAQAGELLWLTGTQQASPTCLWHPHQMDRRGRQVSSGPSRCVECSRSRHLAKWNRSSAPLRLQERRSPKQRCSA